MAGPVHTAQRSEPRGAYLVFRGWLRESGEEGEEQQGENRLS